MELLTRTNFEGWMRKILDRLDRQDELLLAIKAQERQPSLSEGIRLFRQSGLVPAAPDQQAYPATLPQRGRALLQDTGKENLLQRGGRAGLPFKACEGLQAERHRVLQGTHPQPVQ